MGTNFIPWRYILDRPSLFEITTLSSFSFKTPPLPWTICIIQNLNYSSSSCVLLAYSTCSFHFCKIRPPLIASKLFHGFKGQLQTLALKRPFHVVSCRKLFLPQTEMLRIETSGKLNYGFSTRILFLFHKICTKILFLSKNYEDIT